MLFLDYTPDLTETDMIIYRFIVKNMDNVIYMRIRDLADETYCSTASIQRFCQKFECVGWSEFKTRLKLHMGNKNFTKTYPTDLDTNEIIQSITETDSNDNSHKIDEVAEILVNCKHVLWIGAGTSRILAEFGSVTYSSLINMSLLIREPIDNPIIKTNPDEADDYCLIVCSVSGENHVMIKYVANFIKQGIPVIAITNNPTSTIAKMSQYVLTYYATEQMIDSDNVTSQTPAMFLIEKLIRRTSSLSRAKDN
ncbi:MurR/RpiR family transcriptional regulator [Companilactobacillus sp. HBUAS56275]|uniref:MurR/RpiR family transcriptional regulator n=1 Tax=Candidatus Companilactobacillus pullicola TaxID=2838523 RepID=A0A9D1ZP64_9LACO|nr:MurR/RpiR family transcriptional regulator [Candidatus Companilactobacillus pullicola]